jgi:ABC-type Mn2+/Zn2+ transport system ATPase subunit
LTTIILQTKINLIFLDELFDGVDTENVDLILSLLKNLSRTLNLNVIIVHQNQMNQEHFDRIITVTQDNLEYSYLTDTKK